MRETKTTIATLLRHKKLPTLMVMIGLTLLTLLFTSQSLNIKSEQKAKNTTANAVAYFAGGCFWSTESALEKMEGVANVVSGYMDGRETIEVSYDATKVSYDTLTEYFLKNIDPTDPGGSFYDRGYKYTSAIYYATEDEKVTAQGVITQLNSTKKLAKPIVTAIEPIEAFSEAEVFHQDYAQKNAAHYALYRKASGRDDFFAKTWGK